MNMDLAELKTKLRRAFEAVPPAIGKAAVDYARRQLHLSSPLISDFERVGPNWRVTVVSGGQEHDLVVDRNRRIVSIS